MGFHTKPFPINTCRPNVTIPFYANIRHKNGQPANPRVTFVRLTKVKSNKPLSLPILVYKSLSFPKITGCGLQNIDKFWQIPRVFKRLSTYRYQKWYWYRTKTAKARFETSRRCCFSGSIKTS
jgi:hypothetical protein